MHAALQSCPGLCLFGPGLSLYFPSQFNSVFDGANDCIIYCCLVRCFTDLNLRGWKTTLLAIHDFIRVWLISCCHYQGSDENILGGFWILIFHNVVLDITAVLVIWETEIDILVQQYIPWDMLTVSFVHCDKNKNRARNLDNLRNFREMQGLCTTG